MKKETLKGRVDYDDKYDILILKVANRDYRRSVEMDDLLLDLDEHNRISGIRIFDASDFLALSKKVLAKIPHWGLKVSVTDGEVQVRVTFQLKMKDKIIEKTPMITHFLSESLPDSELICEVS